MRCLIIGSGFSGIGMAITLKRAGFHDLTILERAQDLGGVWQANTYPGAACDVFSSLYSYSFEPNPHWSMRYAPQPEIHAYLRHCADKYDVARHVRFGSEVTEATWNEDRSVWTVLTSDGTEHEAEILISAVGQLSRPAIPKIPGGEKFDGPAFHSAEWDHQADLAGKRIAVIGTGASAIQFVPKIAPEAARVTVFQRSAPYLVSRMDRHYSAFEHTMFERVPATQVASRLLTWLFAESIIPGFTKDFGVLHPILHPLASAPLRIASAMQRRWQIRDPRLRRKVTPDYEIGCKRVLFSSDWYPALNRPNVDLITDSVSEITAEGVITADGVKYGADVIIYGTGFAATRFLAPMRVTGRDGADLAQLWGSAAKAHLGLAVHGFPNLFTLYGPNSSLGVGSIVHILESQFSYVTDAVRTLGAGKATTIEVRAEAQGAFVDEMIRRSQRTTWLSGGCHSWYLSDGGYNANNWPGSMTEYRRRTRAIEPVDFTIR